MMFDTYVSKPSSESHYHTHTITEKRAPTDASVRLLREMEQASKEEVIKAVSVKSNDFEAVMHFSKDILSLKNRFAVIYKINGKRNVCEIETDEYDNKEKTANKIHTQLSEHIAANVLSDCVGASLSELNYFRK